MQSVLQKSSSFKNRQSGIELLKITAIFLIILSHVLNTLFTMTDQYPVINFITSTTDLGQFILIVLRHAGAFGNLVFFVSSAWFLLEKKHFNKKKEMFLIADTWFISVIILAAFLVAERGDMGLKSIVKNLFPITFGNNWYITCYIIFYPLSSVLNVAIEKLGQRQHLWITLCMLILYFGFNFVHFGLLYGNYLLFWITIYLLLSYLKKYLPDILENKKLNIIIFIVSVVAHIGLLALTNLLGLKFNFISERILHWNTNCNPILLIMALSLFNLFRQIKFKNVFVNKIASFSLLIYIIHENYLIRENLRPYIEYKIYTAFNGNYILFWCIILTVIIFVVSVIISFIYSVTIQRILHLLCLKVYSFIKPPILKIEKKVLNLHLR